MHTYALVILLIVLACTMSCAAILPPDKPSMAVKVEAGQYTVLGKKVKVAATVEVPVAPADVTVVKDEWHVLGDEPAATWHLGTGLNKTYGPVDIGTRLPFSIAPETVKVHSEEGGGTIYTEGKDYLLDHDWGGLSRVATGAIPQNTKVFFDYSAYRQRVDAVQVAKDGTVSIKKGEAAQVNAQIPIADKDCRVIANIYVPFRTAAITADNIYPLPAKKLGWRDFIKVSGRNNLEYTLHELKTDMPVTIVCWGDSVTSGGSASSPDKTYVELFRTWLKNAYPKADITVINAGIGGSSTESRKAGFEAEVLKHNPDLITVEFVNDFSMSAEKIKANWDEFIAKARAKNPKVEFILITPASIMPAWMGNYGVSIPAMRKAATDNRVALADTANIWENLRRLGIPYMTLNANAINHPNDLGHMFFAVSLAELLKPEAK